MPALVRGALMATKRQIEAYEKRLAKIEQGSQITVECIGAVVTAWPEPALPETVEGTLLGYTHKRAVGLFGDRIQTDVVLCTACAHKRGDCGPGAEVVLKDVLLHSIVRNGSRAEVPS